MSIVQFFYGGVVNTCQMHGHGTTCLKGVATNAGGGEATLCWSHFDDGLLNKCGDVG